MEQVGRGGKFLMQIIPLNKPEVCGLLNKWICKNTPLKVNEFGIAFQVPRHVHLVRYSKGDKYLGSKGRYWLRLYFSLTKGTSNYDFFITLETYECLNSRLYTSHDKTTLEISTQNLHSEYDKPFSIIEELT